MNKKDNNKTTKERTILDKSIESCLVCSSPTSKLHLQVNACYACAAFYRRSINNTHEKYKCQNNSGKCDLTIKIVGKPLCRKCRYKRCQKIGMKTNIRNKSVESLEGDEKILSKLPSTKTDNKTHKKPITLNLNIPQTIEKINILFKKNLMISEETFNYTHEFNILLSNLLNQTKATNPPLIKLENDGIRVKFMNTYFLESAKMLSNYFPFSNLPFNEKVAIHDRIWEQFHALDRYYHTVKNFGNVLDDFRMPVDNYQYWDQSFKASLDEEESKHLTILKPLLNKNEILMNEYKKINPTLEEFAYICQMILWSMHDLSNISLQTRNLAEQITQKISEDFHNYYNNKLRVANYAVRQSKMFKLINITESLVRDKKLLLIANEIFSFGGFQSKYCKFQLKYFEYKKKANINK